MRKFTWCIAVIGLLMLAPIAAAQEYRGRVQGTVTDQSQGALPGATVTLTNTATGVAVTRPTNAEGRYIFDFVDPGTYVIVAELDGFRRVEQRNVTVGQRADLTVDLSLSVGTVNETVTVEAPPIAVQFNNSSKELTLQQELIDQLPIAGRNPYNFVNLDPTMFNTPGSTEQENRPYHHAYATDYDAGGGTRRANDVLLDGVPLGASFKTAYTPSIDAVEEITVSKNSVDAENGHSLGGVISLNMKSGTNNFHGSGYFFGRDPSMNAIADRTVRRVEGADERALRGTELQMYGGTIGGPIMRNKMFFFSSFEQWNDNKPLTVVRTVPTELERSGDFSQSMLNGRVRTIYDPYTSTRNAAGAIVRTPFGGNVIPNNRLDPVALLMLSRCRCRTRRATSTTGRAAITEKVDYWNVSQRVDVNITDAWKVFVRYGQFKANLYQENPTDAGLFPLVGQQPLRPQPRGRLRSG